MLNTGLDGWNVANLYDLPCIRVNQARGGDDDSFEALRLNFVVAFLLKLRFSEHSM